MLKTGHKCGVLLILLRKRSVQLLDLGGDTVNLALQRSLDSIVESLELVLELLLGLCELPDFILESLVRLLLSLGLVLEVVN